MTDPLSESLRESMASRLHSIQLIKATSLVPLARPRAVGVRAARAPYLFIAETHAYPDPQLIERLVAALSGDWSLAVPGFRNANPDSGLSWAGFLSDYGAWSDSLPSGETQRAPSHDVAFRKDVLLEFGDRLEHALTFGDEMYITLQARGQKAYFEPDARIQHVNISRFRSFVKERYLSGVLVGGYRSARWSALRRFVYAAGSPLIPFVILSRIRKGVARATKGQKLPASAMPALVLGVILKSAGEMQGYIVGARESAETGMTKYEVRKLACNEGLEI
jgi:hypothetical protein